MRVETLPPATSMALMVTRRCNMRCGHCSVESGPDVRGEPTEGELLDRVRQAAAGDVRAINLTGGEPMLRPRTVLRLVRAARRLGVATSLTTNGSWGRTAARAWHGVRALRRAGLGSLAVSVDRYHEEFQGPTPAVLIARAAEKAGLPVRISLVVPAGRTDGLAPLVAPFEGLRGTRLRFYGLQAVGRARGLPTETMGGAVDGFCAACAVPAVTDDGRLTACNGPAYFAPGVVAPDRRLAPDGDARDAAGAPSPGPDPRHDPHVRAGPPAGRAAGAPGLRELPVPGALSRHLRPVPSRHVRRERRRGAAGGGSRSPGGRRSGGPRGS